MYEKIKITKDNVNLLCKTYDLDRRKKPYILIYQGIRWTKDVSNNYVIEPFNYNDIGRVVNIRK